MRIGTVEISHPVALGPMAGVTDLPFRRLCREMGCGLLYTEMVSAKALSYHNKNTEPILETEDGEHPLAVQLFGSEPELLADMAKKLEEGPYDIWLIRNEEGSQRAASNIPHVTLGYQIRDFDQDGQMELLVAELKEENKQ